MHAAHSGHDHQPGRKTSAPASERGEQFRGGPRARPKDRPLRLPAPVHEALEGLRKDEPRILAALAEPETAARYLQDPLGTLDDLGIAVPDAVRRRIRTVAADGAALNAPRVVLPDGQVLRPNVTLRIREAE